MRCWDSRRLAFAIASPTSWCVPAVPHPGDAKGLGNSLTVEQSCKGGYQSSPEGKHHGMDIVFVVEFVSEEDRDFYLDADEAHGRFKDLVGKFVADVVVLDFS